MHHLHSSDSLDGLDVIACGGRYAAVLHASRGAGIAPCVHVTWSLVPAAHFILTAQPGIAGLLLGLSDNSVELWSSTSRQRVWRCVSDVRCVLCSMALHITPCGGARVVCGTAFSTAVVWHAAPEGASGGTICRGGHRGAIQAVRWSPDSNSCFVTASEDRTAVLWRAHGECYEPAAEMVSHAGRVWDVSFISPADAAGGVCLATASEDNTLRLWRAEPTDAGTRVAAARELAVLRGHTGRGIWCLAASPRDSRVATGGADGCVMLWPTPAVMAPQSGEQATPVTTDAIVVTEPYDGAQAEEGRSAGASSGEFTRCLCFMDSRTLVAGTNLGAVHLLPLDDADAQQPWCRDIYRTQGGAAVTCIRRGHGPHELVVGDFAGRVALLHLVVQHSHGGVHAELLCTWPAHAPHKLGAVFSFGDATPAVVATADSVGTLRVWDVRCPADAATPLLLGEVVMAQRVVCATGAAIPGGLLLAVGTQGGDVEAFCIPPGDAHLPVSSLGAVAHAHGANAVTALSECQGSGSAHGSTELDFMSGGADGHVCSYLVSGQSHLRRVSRVRVSAVSAPEALVGRPGEGARLLAGITSSDLVVYDHRTGVHTLRVTCGGWRRPHAVLLVRIFLA